MSGRGIAAAPPRYRGVLLDIGNVLIRLRPLEDILRERGLLAQLSPEMPPGRADGEPLPGNGPPPHPMTLFRSDPVLDRFERGRATEAEFYDAVRRAFRVDLPDREIRSLYESILGDSEPGMEEVIRDLRDRGIRVAGLSDTSPVHLALLDRYSAVRALESLVASCRTAFRKPEPGAYRAGLAVLGTPPGETLFVDDQPANVEGARSAGLPAKVFEGAGNLRAFLGLS